MKKRIKDTILVNTRKLVLQVNKGENVSYDDEMAAIHVGDEIDFSSILNIEFKKLTCSPYVTRNAVQRSADYRIDKFHHTKTFKKLAKSYYPVDKS